MTGLDRQNDKIMSVCCFVTDADLKLLDDKGFEAVVHHDQPTLDKMGEWCQKTHGSSGLTTACLASSTSPEVAADGLLAYIKKFVPESRSGLLAGNSVHADKDFLSQPPYGKVIDHLHYRILDVSSLKEAARRWASDDVLQCVPSKKGLHQAREDVLESIEEARFYRETFFLPKEVSKDRR
jgi:oligoribonuclease